MTLISTHFGAKKNGVIVGHLPNEKNGRLAMMVFYFLREDKYAECKVIITGIDSKWMQLPCLLKISRTKKCQKYFLKTFKINHHLPFLLITQPTIWSFEFCKSRYFSKYSFIMTPSIRISWLLLSIDQLYGVLSTFS